MSRNLTNSCSCFRTWLNHNHSLGRSTCTCVLCFASPIFRARHLRRVHCGSTISTLFSGKLFYMYLYIFTRRIILSHLIARVSRNSCRQTLRHGRKGRNRIVDGTAADNSSVQRVRIDINGKRSVRHTFFGFFFLATLVHCPSVDCGILLYNPFCTTARA